MLPRHSVRLRIIKNAKLYNSKTDKIMIHITGINIPVIFIEENNQVTAHCPVLDIATCGYDLDEAKKNFKELVKLFFDELCRMGTIEDVLLESGWKKVRRKPTKWEPPRIIGSSTEEIKVPCPV